MRAKLQKPAPNGLVENIQASLRILDIAYLAIRRRQQLVTLRECGIAFNYLLQFGDCLLVATEQVVPLG